MSALRRASALRACGRVHTRPTRPCQAPRPTTPGPSKVFRKRAWATICDAMFPPGAAHPDCDALLSTSPMNAPVLAPSILEASIVDPGVAADILGDAVRGADDGEIFLERSHSEMFVFDDNRLKSASYDSTEGFGLRVVAGETAGYAHSSEISEAALRRAGGLGGPGQARLCRRRGRGAQVHQREALWRRRSPGLAAFRRQDRPAAGDRRPRPLGRSARRPR